MGNKVLLFRGILVEQNLDSALELPIPMKHVASLKCFLAANRPIFAVITSSVFLKFFI